MAAWYEAMKDPSRESADGWLRSAVRFVLAARQISAQRARGYYSIQRRAELPNEPTWRVPDGPPTDEGAIASSLWFVGPREYVELRKAVDDIFSEERVNAITGSVTRHAMNGGRELIENAVKVDPKVLGYYRIEDADPCYFCAMLMSRGTVFKEDSFDRSDVRFFGPGDAKVHDHCGGGLAPSYTDDPYPAGTREFHELWDGGDWDAAINRAGDPDVVLGWRQFYDARRAERAA